MDIGTLNLGESSVFFDNTDIFLNLKPITNKHYGKRNKS